MPVAGSYQVSVSLRNWVPNKESETVKVPEHGCGEVYFQLRPDGQVSGKAVEADGTPARRVLLKLATAADFGETLETLTGEDGRYQFHGVLPGKYRLGINTAHTDEPSPKVPYATTFYPGVGNESHAGVIQVREYERVKLNSFRLPARLYARTIHVKTVLENGQPLEGASISCTPEGRGYWKKDLTDAKGEKSFAAMDGIGYIVDAAIRSTHPLANAGYERAKWVRVGPGQGVTEVKIVFLQKQKRR